jgi:hypothetical protein
VGFGSVISLTGGQVGYLTETYFSSPDFAWGSYMSSAGVYDGRSSDKRRGRRGIVVIMLSMMVAVVMLPLVGLAIDGSILYLVQAKLSAAVDAAALAAARSLSVGLDLPAKPPAPPPPRNRSSAPISQPGIGIPPTCR